MWKKCNQEEKKWRKTIKTSLIDTSWNKTAILRFSINGNNTYRNVCNGVVILFGHKNSTIYWYDIDMIEMFYMNEMQSLSNFIIQKIKKKNVKNDSSITNVQQFRFSPTLNDSVEIKRCFNCKSVC